MARAKPTIIARDACHCAACGRPYPAAAAAYRASVLALLTPAELAALDPYATRAFENPEARPGDAVERDWSLARHAPRWLAAWSDLRATALVGGVR